MGIEHRAEGGTGDQMSNVVPLLDSRGQSLFLTREGLSLKLSSSLRILKMSIRQDLPESCDIGLSPAAEERKATLQSSLAGPSLRCPLATRHLAS